MLREQSPTLCRSAFEKGGIGIDGVDCRAMKKSLSQNNHDWAKRVYCIQVRIIQTYQG